MDTGNIAVVLGLIATAISILNGYASIKQRKNAPTEERWKEMNTWRESVDSKLDSDMRRLNKADLRDEQHAAFERVTLHSIKGILDHFTTGDHVEQMKTISSEIDKFLIGR